MPRFSHISLSWAAVRLLYIVVDYTISDRYTIMPLQKTPHALMNM